VKDELWIGTFEHGLNIMDINTGKVKKRYAADVGALSLKNNFIVSLLQTRSGTIYLGTANGLCQYNPKEDNFLHPKGVAESSFVSCILEDHEGTIWIATNNSGLFYLNPSTGTKGHLQNEPGNENSLTSNTINSLYEDTDGNLWLAMEGGGLCRLDRRRKQITRYSTLNGLPSNFVFKVLEGKKGSFWITTSKGLANLDIIHDNITVYTKANGLLNDQFNYNSGYKDKQGNLYFGSVQGMIQFNPDSFYHNTFIPPVYITGFQVQNKEIDVRKDSDLLQKSIIYTDKIVLPYNQSSFSIDYKALSFTSPETTEYSYIMNGLNKEWTHLTSNRKVYFTNLKPGTYRFKVKAGNNGVWGQQIKELKIIITPPFWATPWAYTFYAVIFLLLVYYLVRAYHYSHENKKEKEIYQAKIEFFTNIAHEIKTPLTLIKGPVENLNEMIGDVPGIKEDVLTMERNTDRLINLVNQILDFRQTETKGFSLDFYEVNINDILREAYVTFKPVAKKRSLNYILELPSSSTNMLADAEALTKIFHNLFSNAVKYAHKEVTAKLLPPKKGEYKLMIEISNDGYLIPGEMKEKIFEPFFRIKETNKQKGTGLGLALARSLVELHNGRIYIKETETNCNIFIVELPYPTLQTKRKNVTETNTNNV
jgi:signal transduction histidine kinase